jgi:hypothetical protein
MIKSKYLIVGDNFIGLEVVKVLLKKNKKIAYADASNKDITIPDFLAYKTFTHDYLIRNPKDSTAQYIEAKKKFELEYKKRIDHLILKQRLIHLPGQPELVRENLAGIHNINGQELIEFEKIIYVPSAKNFVENVMVKDINSLSRMPEIWNDINTIKSLGIITDKWQDVEVAYSLSKLKLKITLVVPTNIFEIIKEKIGTETLTIIDVNDLKEVVSNTITTHKNITVNKIYYNYNSLVNHHYYNLNEKILKNVLVLGDSVNQNYETVIHNLEEKFVKPAIERMYEESEYTVSHIRLRDTILTYSNISREDEIISDYQLEDKNVKGVFKLNKKNVIITAYLEGEDSVINYFYNRIRSNLNLKEVVSFLKLNV